MASTFSDRIDELSRAVGHGTLRGKVTVDQVYAHYIHEGVSQSGEPLVMHRGGQSHFLRDPLFQGTDARMEKLALKAITPEGSDIRDGMSDAMEDLSDDVHELAPREFGNLRNSGHPQVFDEGAEIYDRAPHVPRLTEAELRAEHKRALAAAEGRDNRATHNERRGK